MHFFLLFYMIAQPLPTSSLTAASGAACKEALCNIVLWWERKGAPFRLHIVIIPMWLKLMVAGGTSSPQNCVPKSIASHVGLV